MRNVTLLFIFSLVMITGSGIAQTGADIVLPDTSRLQGIVSAPDELPQFPGGSQALMRFLSANLQYPTRAVERNINGKVMARFVVCEDGSLCNEQILNSLDPSCDREVLRVIRAMPKWQPGLKEGKPIKTYYNLPVQFHLQD